MKVTVSFKVSDIITEAKKQFALLGKRSGDKQGQSLFSNVTISSAEEDAMEHYVYQGIDSGISDILPFVDGYAVSSGTVTFGVENTRWQNQNNKDFSKTFTNNFESYVVAYTVYEFLLLTHPEYASKLVAGVTTRLQSLHRLMFFKYPPAESGKTYADIRVAEPDVEVRESTADTVVTGTTQAMT